ncbi:hypothetical protein ACFL02_02070 [Planctomycetota bacterium]
MTCQIEMICINQDENGAWRNNNGDIVDPDSLEILEPAPTPEKAEYREFFFPFLAEKSWSTCHQTLNYKDGKYYLEDAGNPRARRISGEGAGRWMARNKFSADRVPAELLSEFTRVRRQHNELKNALEKRNKPMEQTQPTTRPQLNFVQQAKLLAKEENISYRAAASRLAREIPELHQQYVQSQQKR